MLLLGRVGLIQVLAALKLMRTLALLLLLLVVGCSSFGAARRQALPYTVLFVGNSLTYVGNTPAVFDALASANGTQVSSDLIVRGGATLTERVNDGTVVRALAKKHYSVVVLQERGGDLMCSFGTDSCTQSRQAIRVLVALAKKAGTRTTLLGTYQSNPMASEQLVEAESAAALEAAIPYIEVSRKLQKLRAASPGLDWFAPDGMHPGPELALLNAMLLHQSLLHKPPRPVSFIVNAPIYGSNSGLVEEVRKAEDPPPHASTPRGIEYTSDTLKTLLPFAVVDASS